VTPTLIEAPRESSFTGLGFITVTPKRLDLASRFTLIDGGMNASECLYWLYEIHRYYRRKVIMVWDGLPAHRAAETIMDQERPGWFEYHYFPSYAPELNPVEPCWHHTKNIEMANYTAKNKDELARKIFQATENINKNKQLLASFFKYTRLKI
jgi:hypothetical protein